MVVHEGRHGADLHSVGVVGRVLKQAVVRVEELSRHQEEELSGGAAVVKTTTHTHTCIGEHTHEQIHTGRHTHTCPVECPRWEADSPLLPHEANVELAPLQVFTGVTHDLVEGIFQEVVPADDQSGRNTQTHNHPKITAYSNAPSFTVCFGFLQQPQDPGDTHLTFPGPWP